MITAAEKKQSDGYWLHSIRKEAAKKVKNKGATSYIHRIKMITTKNNITYKGIDKPKDFWSYLASFPDKSISRVWYSGHASARALFLALTHDNACTPGALPSDSINMDDIKNYKHLESKFDPKTKHSSQFYGCFTAGFAKSWNKNFSISAEGAVNKIDFSVIDKPSNIVNILERIRKTPTTQGSPDWQKHN